MLTVTYLLNCLGMIALPIVLAFYVTRKFSLPWKLIFAGGLTFIASQILHIPVLYGLTAMFHSGVLPAIPTAWVTLFNAILLGLLAGVFEETARWILFKFILKDASTWEQGVVVGTGYGGTEALILGVIAFTSVIGMITMRNADLSTRVPPEQLALAKHQLAAFWSSPVYMALLGFVERVFAICLQISLTIMVLYSVVFRKPAWFWIALLWHAVVDALSVYLLPLIGALAIEAVIGVCAAISLVILFRLRPKFIQPPAGTAPLVEPGS
ncbi:MAG: YhfC family glutamic-type intramembrane protease [Bacteroidota bacterium]|jgi:uncharacterized membrane protein YhfC